LLRQQAGTVAEVAYQVGFQDADYFARLFRQMFACTPSEYLKKPTN
jgi:AraC-like DNA-binding protein